MPSEKLPGLLLISSVLIFTGLMITLTHSGYKCNVDVASGRSDCAAYGIDQDEEAICQGSVFQITAQESGKDIIIVCPWGFITTLTNFIGVLAGLVFAALTILQRLEKEFGTRKFAVRLGFLSSLLLAVSVVVMGINIHGGYNKCKEFEAALEDNSYNADCSIAAFSWDLGLMCLGVVLLGIEAILEYRKYRFGNDTELVKDEQTQAEEANSYQARFFEDN